MNRSSIDEMQPLLKKEVIQRRISQNSVLRRKAAIPMCGRRFNTVPKSETYSNETNVFIGSYTSYHICIELYTDT